MGIFMVGGIAVIASIMRIYALYIFAVSDDIEYDDIFVSLPSIVCSFAELVSWLTILQILLLSQIEANVAMMSACAPAYRPLFVKFFSSSSGPSNETPGEYPTIGSGGPVYARRRASRNDIELFSVCRGRNSSEEDILGDEGIRKTVDVSIIEEEAEKERIQARVDMRDEDNPAHWRWSNAWREFW
jgi:hypothetical protein